MPPPPRLLASERPVINLTLSHRVQADDTYELVTFLIACGLFQMVKFPACGPLGGAASLAASLEVPVPRPAEYLSSHHAAVGVMNLLPANVKSARLAADAKFLQAAEGSNTFIVP